MVAFVIFEKKYWLFVLATLSETKVRNRYPQARGRASLSLLYGLPTVMLRRNGLLVLLDL